MTIVYPVPEGDPDGRTGLSDQDHDPNRIEQDLAMDVRFAIDQFSHKEQDAVAIRRERGRKRLEAYNTAGKDQHTAAIDEYIRTGDPQVMLDLLSSHRLPIIVTAASLSPDELCREVNAIHNRQQLDALKYYAAEERLAMRSVISLGVGENAKQDAEQTTDPAADIEWTSVVHWLADENARHDLKRRRRNASQ